MRMRVSDQVLQMVPAMMRMLMAMQTKEPAMIMKILMAMAMQTKEKKASKRNYILAPDEEEPERTTQSKHFIDKVMFISAVTRPRFGVDGTVIFDGKIGTWPFTYCEPAQRTSVNRPRGTMVTKPLAVTKDVSRDYLVNKVLPAIKEKWPVEERGPSLQSLFHKSSPRSVDDIIAKVEQAWAEYPVKRSNHVFLTHQKCMQEIMRIKGGHHYKIPHMKKESLERNGGIPVMITCDPTIVNEAREYVME
ncbi:uncharacterized protein LOC100838703 [Brachypodium distachyon]|uniref:uncharacterized protein LOC100838703 n=1 Tax=Brachypodium distachyon TaxID=15368 RepID=UPI00052FDFE4|nr:uncharacterized protein LOC100838703 [Brachypodium distachyon]|eukprot:XP_010236788.1 uncharacterized protein LOC100838703 [Brachypodium distachyon]